MSLVGFEYSESRISLYTPSLVLNCCFTSSLPPPSEAAILLVWLLMVAVQQMFCNESSGLEGYERGQGQGKPLLAPKFPQTMETNTGW